MLEKACTDCGIERIHKNAKVYFMDVQAVSDELLCVRIIYGGTC